MSQQSLAQYFEEARKADEQRTHEQRILLAALDLAIDAATLVDDDRARGPALAAIKSVRRYFEAVVDGGYHGGVIEELSDAP